MSETELLNSVYILELDHYTEFCDLFKSCKSFSEQSLECTLHGFENIDLDSDEWLKHPLRVDGNILLFPFRHDRLGWCLTPWQIIKCWDRKTMVHCKWSLEMRLFNFYNKNNWKTSSMRKYLNRENFINKFSDVVKTHVVEHDVWTHMEVVKDKFWLLSWEELGEKSSSDADLNGDFTTYDMNSQIFTSKDDRKKPYIEHVVNHGSNSSTNDWWLRSARSNDDYYVGYVNYDGYVNRIYASSYSCCSPAFVFESGSHLSI